jgi:hypothetical protein
MYEVIFKDLLLFKNRIILQQQIIRKYLGHYESLPGTVAAQIGVHLTTGALQCY